MKEVRNIKKATLNGRQVKLFELWKKENRCWYFDGQYSAPVSTPNKNLLSYVEENEDFLRR